MGKQREYVFPNFLYVGFIKHFMPTALEQPKTGFFYSGLANVL
jgi:hypothetical protein